MNRRAVCGVATLTVLLAAGLWSCIPFLSRTERAPVEVGRGTVAILPFATLRRDYFDSQLGARFSRSIAKLVAEGRPKATVVDVDEAINRLAAKGKQPPTGGGWDVVRLGEDIGADYVLIGEIHELSGKPPKSYGTLAGTMVVSANVVDVAARNVVWMSERKTYRYPPLFMGKEPIAADEIDEEVVIRKVMDEAARGIAAVFVGRTKAFNEYMDERVR